MDEFLKNGVRSEGLIPVFVSKTFPNHYSIATGLYVENHGLIGNHFYDSKFDDYYTLSDREKVEDQKFYGGEPIWVTAEKQGIKINKDQARELVYGMPYEKWKSNYQIDRKSDQKLDRKLH